VFWPNPQPATGVPKQKIAIFLPEPLRRARSWNCIRLALDPGTRLSLHKKLRVLTDNNIEMGRLLFTIAARELFWALGT